MTTLEMVTIAWVMAPAVVLSLDAIYRVAMSTNKLIKDSPLVERALIFRMVSSMFSGNESLWAFLGVGLAFSICIVTAVNALITFIVVMIIHSVLPTFGWELLGFLLIFVIIPVIVRLLARSKSKRFQFFSKLKDNPSE